MSCFQHPDNISQLFVNGMKRHLPFEFPYFRGGKIINLGSGMAPMEGADNLDRPKWEAPVLDYLDNSVGAIHAYHFLEHLSSDTVKDQMREVARVLLPGGLFYYCVPYAMAPIAFMDVDHKTFWTEETMRTMMSSRGYNSGILEDILKYRFQAIIGANSQNLAVMGVLEKVNS